MMSSNREDYASPLEWLKEVKEDEAWQSQLQRLQSDDESNDDIRQQALKNFSRNFTFDYWNTYKHKIEPTVCDVWEDRELTLVKLKIYVISMLTLEWLDDNAKGKKAEKKAPKKQENQLPEQLQTEKAQELLRKLCKAKLMTDDWQTKGLSGAQKGLLASLLSQRLGIEKLWQVFGELWGVNPETLRSYFNKALGQGKTFGFQERLKNILG